ncbi:hypothetical protein GCM10010365_15490 [Streptomyces poonensis]|uniref:Uncharacterized protein n=1 Tax=Streptomyces poonensis TaxID=68255 RepID=A0A918UEX9_9ACTN|nr:hypothetical protein GCM10010365_15490 [Streptomyces poonensis]
MAAAITALNSAPCRGSAKKPSAGVQALPAAVSAAEAGPAAHVPEAPSVIRKLHDGYH